MNDFNVLSVVHLAIICLCLFMLTEKRSFLQVPEFKNFKMIPSGDREIPDNIFDVSSSLVCRINFYRLRII